jgi:hypothetical protein
MRSMTDEGLAERSRLAFAGIAAAGATPHPRPLSRKGRGETA